MAISNPGTLIGQVRAGRIRALSYNAAQRSPLLPNVPTMIEAGVSGMELEASWYGVFAPARTPAVIVSRMHAEIRKALGVAAVRESWEEGASTLTIWQYDEKLTPQLARQRTFPLQGTRTS